MNIGNFFQELRGGLTAREIEEALVELSRQVAVTGKSGSLTISITLEPAGQNRITVKDKISSAVPQPNRGSTLFFQLENAELSRSNPDQVSLHLLKDFE